MILIMTVAGGFFMDRNKMSKKGYKTLISGALAGLIPPALATRNKACTSEAPGRLS